MFVQLDPPQFYLTADGKKRWFVTTRLESKDELQYVNDDCTLVSHPVRYSSLERVWNLAAKYYADNNEIYPYAYVEADDACILMSDTIINALHKAMANRVVKSTVMEFE